MRRDYKREILEVEKALEQQSETSSEATTPKSHVIPVNRKRGRPKSTVEQTSNDLETTNAPDLKKSDSKQKSELEPTDSPEPTKREPLWPEDDEILRSSKGLSTNPTTNQAMTPTETPSTEVPFFQPLYDPPSPLPRQALTRFGRQIFLGLNEEQYEMQMQRTIVDLQEILPFFEIFFETQVDDAEKPPTGQLMNAIIHGFSTGEWLLVKDKSSGTILGVVYLAYGHPGRDCQLTVCPFSDDLDLKKVVDYIFSSGKNHPPHSYFKIKAKSPASWKTETIFVRAGFQPVGRYEADGLLQGKLSTIISYECFHPTWAKASGEELDED